MPYASAEKQPSYQRLWAKNKRAEAKASSALTQEERIAALEAELRDLKNTVPAYIVEPTPEELQEERIQKFKSKLYKHSESKSIATRRAEFEALEREYNDIVSSGYVPDKLNLLRGLAAQRDGLNALEKEADSLDKDIALWDKGGSRRKGFEATYAHERQRAKGLLSSPDPQEQRKGEALLRGCDKEEGKVELTVARWKSRRDKLRS